MRGRRRAAGGRTTYMRGPPSPSGDGYFTLAPDFNRSRLPWDSSAGSWGDAAPFVEPTLPTTTSQTSVSTQSAFNSAAAVNGAQVTVTANISSACAITGDDVDVIIPSGIILACPIQLESCARVRVRGSTAGSYSGGRVGQVRSFGVCTDVVIDGLDCNGLADYGAIESNQSFRITQCERIAVLNCRAIAGGYCWQGTNQHVLFAYSNLYHGAASHNDTGYPEGWGIRNHSGPIIVWRCHIEGTRYAQIRGHSEAGPGETLYVGQSTLVALAEARSCWAWPNLGNNAGIGHGFIWEENETYAYSAGSPCTFTQAEFSVFQCRYSRARNNNFYGMGVVAWTQAYLDSLEAGGGGPTEEGPGADPPGDHDWSDLGNTMTNGVTTLPAWGGPGDPTEIPLPGGMTLIRGEGDCPGIAL